MPNPLTTADGEAILAVVKELRAEVAQLTRAAASEHPSNIHIMRMDKPKQRQGSVVRAERWAD